MNEIRHIVVLMMENRSFDHLLGYLDVDELGPIGTSGINHTVPGGANSPAYRSFQYANDFDVNTDPSHRHDQVTLQMQGTRPPLRSEKVNMSGFVASYLHKLPPPDTDQVDRIMGWHPAEQAPALAQLARANTVCSRWFSSVPGETWPNRMFAHAGHSHATVGNVIRRYDEDRTVFDALHEAKTSWALYAGDIPQAACYLGFSDVFKHRMQTLEDFDEDVENGNLPAYSFIEPKHLLGCNSQHPNHSVYLGDQLVRRIYNRLASNREIWDHLLFILTWDEHGGFFDRVPPGPAVPPIPGQVSDDDYAFPFDVYGVRVPAVLISPWSAPGSVSALPFDHTSIVRTVFDVFDLPGHLHQRDKVAHSVVEAIDVTADRRAPITLEPAPHEHLRTASLVQAGAEQEMVSLDDLDSFQKSLLDLKDQLDVAAGYEPGVRELGPAGTPADELDQLVHQFRARYMGRRGRRALLDATE